MSTGAKHFPHGFLWGSATASYQIEGATQADGRGESIWDRFCHTPGKVHEGETGDIACDHFHHYLEDVQLMKDIGLNAYRFSIAWPRIVPEKGVINQKGLDFYKRLLEALHHHGIMPAATIYHWDLPQWLEDEGGWVNRQTVDYYSQYAETLFRELGDAIPLWITHNEPWCAAFLGYALGVHAPGRTNPRAAVTAAHHLLLSHGLAVEAFRATMKDTQQIGITLNLTPAEPATPSSEDVAAALRSDGLSNRWFLDPLFRSQYPEDMRALLEANLGPMDFVRPGDLAKISQPIDFLGVNFYTRTIVANDPMTPLVRFKSVPGEGPVTEMGWEVHPASLYSLLKRIEGEYTKIPLYITENGAAYDDKLEDGEVNDQGRIDYLQKHFAAAHRFLSEGGNLKGYFVWSLMDNFEWAFGYSKRFGLVYVDYETQKRIPKASANWYRQVITENALTSPVLQE